MKNVNYKKLILPNIPYVFIGLLATKLGQAARLSPGVDFSSKAMNIMQPWKITPHSTLSPRHSKRHTGCGSTKHPRTMYVVSADVAWMNTETATNISSAAETHSRRKRNPATDAVIPVTITF